MNTRIFDKNNSYQNRIRLLQTFLPEKELSDLESNFLKQYSSEYFQFLDEIISTIIRNNKSSSTEEKVMIKSFAASIDCFGKKAFTYMAKQEEYISFFKILLTTSDDFEKIEYIFQLFIVAVAIEAIPFDENLNIVLNCLDLKEFSRRTATISKTKVIFDSSKIIQNYENNSSPNVLFNRQNNSNNRERSQTVNLMHSRLKSDVPLVIPITEKTKKKSKQNQNDRNGEKYIDHLKALMRMFFEALTKNDNTFKILFPILKYFIEELYVNINDGKHVTCYVHNLLANMMSKISITCFVYMLRYEHMIDYLLNIVKETCYRVLSTSDNEDNFRINMDLYKVLLNQFIIGKYTNEILSLITKNDTSDPKVKGVTKTQFFEFQKFLIIGLELMIIYVQESDQSIIQLVTTDIKKIYEMFLEAQTVIENELLILLCKVARTIVWRFSFFGCKISIHEERKNPSEMRSFMLTKALDFAFSALPLWIVFMKDDNEWDLFYQKIAVVYSNPSFVGRIKEYFMTLTLLLIKRKYEINIQNEINLCQKHVAQILEFPKITKISQFRFETFSTDELFEIWKRFFNLLVSAVSNALPLAMEEIVNAMKVILAYFVCAEELTGLYHLIPLHNYFVPFYVFCTDEQRNINVIHNIIVPFSLMIMRPIRYPDQVYKLYDSIMCNALLLSNKNTIELMPHLNPLLTLDLPLTSLFQPIMLNIVNYNSKGTCIEDEFHILNIVLSFAIYEQQHPLNKNDFFEYIENITNCYRKLMKNFSFAETRDALFWSIGNTIVLNVVNHSSTNEKYYLEFVPLLDILFEYVKDNPKIYSTALKNLVYIARQLIVVEQWYFDHILSFLLELVLYYEKTELIQEQESILLELIELFENIKQFQIQFAPETIDLLSQVIHMKTLSSLSLNSDNSMNQSSKDVKFKQLLTETLTLSSLEELSVDENEIKNNHLKEILQSIVMTTFPTKSFRQSKSHLNVQTSWWLIGNSIVAIRPTQNGKLCEIAIRDISTTWMGHVYDYELNVEEVKNEGSDFPSMKTIPFTWNEHKGKKQKEETILEHIFKEEHIEQVDYGSINVKNKYEVDIKSTYNENDIIQTMNELEQINNGNMNEMTSYKSLAIFPSLNLSLNSIQKLDNQLSLDLTSVSYDPSQSEEVETPKSKQNRTGNLNTQRNTSSPSLKNISSNARNTPTSLLSEEILDIDYEDDTNLKDSNEQSKRKQRMRINDTNNTNKIKHMKPYLSYILTTFFQYPQILPNRYVSIPIKSIERSNEFVEKVKKLDTLGYI